MPGEPARDGSSARLRQSLGSASPARPGSGRVGALTRIGPYEVLAELGRGSFGVVYKVSRAGTPGVFALKVNLAKDPLDVERFLREAEIARRLEDPGLVRVLDVGQHAQHPWYVMELCEGETLHDRLRRGPLDVAESVRLVRDLARTVSSVHAQGVLHRDLKPENVILDPATGRPRLTDFGLARDRAATSLTQTGEQLGTPYYMAPELFVDAKRADHRADVWSLGVILYECLTGRVPFLGQRADEVAQKIHAGIFVAPRSLRAEIPPAVEAVCLRALARAPVERHESVRALALALEGALAAEHDRAPARALDGARSRAGRRLVVVALGGVAVLLVAGAAVLVRGGGPSSLLGRKPAPAAAAAPPPRSAPPKAAPAPARRDASEARAALEAALAKDRALAPADEVTAAFEGARALAKDDPELVGRIELALLAALRNRGRHREVVLRLDALHDVPPAAARRARLLGVFSRKHSGDPTAVAGEIRALGEGSDATAELARAWTPALDGAPIDASRVERAIQLDPDFTQARVCRATLAWHQGRLEDALSELEDVRRSAPNEVELLWTIASIDQELRRPEASLDPLDRLVALGGEHPEFEALYQRARSDTHLGRWEPARAFLDRALAERPGDMTGLMLRALCSWSLGDRARAATDWSDAAARGLPEFQKTLDQRYRQPDLQAVIWSCILASVAAPSAELLDATAEQLARLRRAAPGNAEVLRLEGIRALAGGGALEAVLEPWRKAVKLDPARGIDDSWLARLAALHPECTEGDALRARR